MGSYGRVMVKDDIHVLKDGSAIDMGSDTTWHVRRSGSEEEDPPVLLPARLRQLLKIEHLTNWRSP